MSGESAADDLRADGAPAPSPGATREIDTRSVPWTETYRILTGVIQPRPIAWVSTLSLEGRPNLAPFSFFNMVSGAPPALMIAPLLRGRDGTLKDTPRNIRDTGEFVVAAVTEALADAANRTSADLPPDVNEFAHVGLTPAPAREVKPSLVAESPVNLECRLIRMIELGTGPGAGTVIIGEILRIHVREPLVDAKGFVDPDALRAVGRMGAEDYTRTRDRFVLPRPA